MYITYASTTGPDSQKLKFAGSGSGGVAEFKSQLPDDIIAFGIVRVTDKIDDSVTVKFVWVNWLGKKVKTMQKARLSVHLGPVKTFMGQTHQDYTCNTQDELTHEIIMERVMGYSGSGSKVIDSSTGKTTLKSQVGGVGTSSTVTTKKENTEVVSWIPDVPAVIRDVKGDHSPLSWAMITYDNPDSHVLVVHAAGEGEDDNIATLAGLLTPDAVFYCIVRKTEIIDNSVTAKFVYIRWIGENVPRMQKAKLGTHAGDIYNLFAPCHTSLDSPDLHEITDENIMKQIMIASGTFKHVLEGHPQPVQEQRVAQPRAQVQQQAQQAPRPAQQPRQQPSGPVKSESKVIELINESEIRQAIADVRNDASETNWVLVTYDAPQSKTLKLEATGTGNLAELKSHLRQNSVMYGLYRTTEQIDDSVTIKFTYVVWHGEKIHVMQRAKLATHSGAVRDIFLPFHVDVLASSDDELTEEIITKKIKSAAGTAVHVLNL
uniref:Coactosin n=1 Tax=Arcella intermedia TaxID=1963864 RepID=A0A6B2L1Y6_9EUKA